MWVATRAAVEDAIETLLARRVHEQLPGYLCMLWAAARAGRADQLRPDFAAFHDYFLRVPGRTDYPYLRPFRSSKVRSDAAIWMNANVAGSYAPSSIRSGGTLPKVLEVDGSGATARYSLRESHATLALTHLAFEERLPAVPLALFLYREFAFDEPSLPTVVSVFRYEFGYEPATGGQPSPDWSVLFDDDSDASPSSDLFEELVA